MKCSIFFSKFYQVLRNLLALPLLFAQFANATPPTGYPDVPHFGYQSHYRAVWNLFDGQADEIRELKFNRVSSAQYDAIFAVKYANQDWFVKTMLIDNNDPFPMHFEYEWELKEKLAGSKPLAEVNGEIAFADRAAFFTNKREQYYIASYPFLLGKTMHHYAAQYNKTRSANDAGTLKQAIYRYAQVSARLHFDPNDLPKDNENLLNRPVQIYLEDRNSNNELYDQATDKVYLIDYPIGHDYYQASIIVKESLEDALIAALIQIAGSKEDGQSFIDTFISGYIDALPQYDSALLRAIVNDVLIDLQAVIDEDEEEAQDYVPKSFIRFRNVAAP